MNKIIYNKQNRQRLITALCMACMGAAAGAVSENYPVPQSEPDSSVSQKTEREIRSIEGSPVFSYKATPSDALEEVEEERPFVFIPYSGQLNLAYFYPEGADESDRLNSYAGSTFKKLTKRDAEWMSEIYDLSSRKPEQAAKSLGRSADSVRGRFNPNDEEQKEDDPASWMIHSWKRVNMAFYDENGRQIPAYSNVKDILSMASVYTYYAGMEDHELFESYAQELWKRSHSYSYSISDVYYCDGCLNGEDSEISDESGSLDEEDEEEVIDGPGAAAPKTERAAALENAGTGGEAPAENTGQTEAAPQEAPAAEETAGSSAAQAETENAGKAGTAGETESSPQVYGPGADIGPGVELATPSDAVYTESPAASENNAPQEPIPDTKADDAQTSGAEPKVKCPGHVDLNIHVVISGINGLFQKDTIGNDKRNLKEGGWPGWDTYNRYYAKKINSQDWMEQYELSVTEICVRNPLSAGEIESYMALLPEDVSENREKIIQFALSSVGRVPYYWGGKPEAANYEGNAFCSLMLPDSKGRSLRGLDCSGWINWVYWSALGMRLPYEGTDGLATYGMPVRREDLKPGDIIVKRGSNAHVVMFLNWQPDGTMQVIHETSGGINNVTVGTMNANWPYYRRILD